jgi:hypothetical protein
VVSSRGWGHINFRNEHLSEIPGKVYGKVTAVQPTGENLHEAAIRFTSVSPEPAQIILKATTSKVIPQVQ